MIVLGPPIITYSGDFADAEELIASDWADRADDAASEYREEYDNEEAARIMEERDSGAEITEQEAEERLGAISDLTMVMVWVGDEESSRCRRLYGEFDDGTIRRLFPDGEGPLHVECETTVYEDV